MIRIKESNNFKEMFKKTRVSKALNDWIISV